MWHRKQSFPPTYSKNNMSEIQMRLFICFSSYLNLDQSDHQIASEYQLPDNVAENDDVNSVQSGCSCAGRGAGLRAICNSCRQRLPPTVLLHSSTWYSCINRPFTGSPTTGRDNALPCSTHTSCQVSCLTNRKTPVMFKSRMLGPQNLHHCWISLAFSCDYRSVGISCVEGKNQQNSVRTRTGCLTGYAHLPTCYEALSSLTMENTPKQGSLHERWSGCWTKNRGYQGHSQKVGSTDAASQT